MPNKPASIRKAINLTLTLAVLLCSCSKQVPNHASICFDAEGPDLVAKIRQYKTRQFEKVLLSEINLDSSGAGGVKIPMTQLTMVYYEVGQSWGALLLKPGDDFKISLTADGTAFNGEGSKVNNYLNVVDAKFTNAMGGGKNYMIDLELNAFLSRFDSLRADVTLFHNNYVDTVDLPKDQISLLQKRNEIRLAFLKQHYANMAINNAMVEQRFALIEGSDVEQDDPPKEFLSNGDNAPFDTNLLLDTTLLNVGIPQYEALLGEYLQAKVYIPMFDPRTIEEMLPRIPVMADKEIRTSDLPKPLIEYFLGKNIEKYLSILGITPGIDSLFMNFKISNPNAPSLAAVQKQYDAWLPLTTGKPAQDFKGITMDGKSVSLRELKGKVVYVDGWATWCGPCVIEIPHAKKLMKKYENNDQVVFLFLSVRDSLESWKKKLLQEKDWKGIHIWLDQKESDLFLKTYKGGLPTYLLIDQNGNIVSVNAPRPHSEKAKEEIDKLLKI